MEKAGFFARFIAWILDNIVMSILVGVIVFVGGGIIGLTESSDSTLLGILAGTTAIILVVVMLFFQFLYFGYFWSSSGKSLGMRMLSIKVVRQGAGEDLSFIRAGLRGTFGYWVSALVFGLGYIWAIFDAENETWHDKIFNTWVVKD